MPSIQVLLLILTLFTSFINPTTSQSCNSYTFPNNLNYARCSDLHKNNVKDSSWIAWAINPTSKGMLGSQALIGYQNFDGSFKAYTSSITSYQTMLQEDNLSFPVYNLSGMFVNGSMMIFASLQLPQNVTLVNHAWQEGLVSNDGSLKSHALRGPNIQSFGTLDFTSGNIISQNVGAKLKSKMMLRIKKLQKMEKMKRLMLNRYGGLTRFYIWETYRPKKYHKYRIIWWNIFHFLVGYTTIVLAI
ncbi:auxin-responsive family protein [Medicago truncatula]|uniref:Auxin-responsive family protein n=1 Tax=Medicago truncatula TaxID=3880 RepID=G7KXE1_MEDTR|nr:auxin-responsive family protein [Medicago truncatula]